MKKLIDYFLHDNLDQKDKEKYSMVTSLSIAVVFLSYSFYAG